MTYTVSIGKPENPAYVRYGVKPGIDWSLLPLTFTDRRQAEDAVGLFIRAIGVAAVRIEEVAEVPHAP